MERIARALLIASPIVALLGLPGLASAQQAAPGAAPPARCTGLFCDMYYASVPAGQPAEPPLPCHDFVCGMFGGRTPDHPAVQQAAVSPEPVAEPVKAAHKVKRKKHVAKAATQSAESGADTKP